MMKQNRRFVSVVILCLAAGLSAMMLCTSCTDSSSDYVKNSGSAIDFEESEYVSGEAVVVLLDGDNVTTDSDGIETNGSKITVKKAGNYIFEGTLNDGQICVDAGKSAKVELIFNGVYIASSDSSAIYVKNADEVCLTLADGSHNSITDGESYADVNDGNTPDAALFSKADLIIRGNGSLTAVGRYKHGIVSKRTLTVEGGILEINAEKCGIEGKDQIRLAGADITVSSGTDGIRSTNSDDSTLGCIYIESGKVKITSGNDGIQAENTVTVQGGDVSIISGGGSEAASKETGNEFDFKHMRDTASDSTDSISGKGIKAENEIRITGGELVIDSYDDAIHSGENITVCGGDISISAGDDGLHADGDILISDGKVSVLRSYEGVEGYRVEISGGDVSIVSSDDAINGTSSDEITDQNANTKGGEVIISGGQTYADASGDGIDSNGTFTVSGGILLISGPEDSANGAIDYEISAEITGGIVCAFGSRDMAQNFTSAEGQGVFLTSFESQNGGTSFAVTDSSGNVIVLFTPEKSYDSALVSAPNIIEGETYTISSGGVCTDTDERGTAFSGTLSGELTLSAVKMTSSIVGDSNGGFRTFGGDREMNSDKPEIDSPTLPNGEAPGMPRNGQPPFMENNHLE